MINTKTKGELGRRIEYDVEHDLFHPQNIYSDEYITPTFVEYVQKLENENAELTDEVRKLKILVSSLVYEINQIWDINEMNDDLRRCAEKIDREVQLSKMAEDNRMVISALGFAIVPPKPKLYVNNA